MVIARLLGWRRHQRLDGTESDVWIRRDGAVCLKAAIPNYPESVREAQDAVRRLAKGELFYKWAQCLVDILARDNVSSEGDISITDIYSPVEMCVAAALASAAQICEALLRALDQWEDAPSLKQVVSTEDLVAVLKQLLELSERENPSLGKGGGSVGYPADAPELRRKILIHV